MEDDKYINTLYACADLSLDKQKELLVFLKGLIASKEEKIKANNKNLESTSTNIRVDYPSPKHLLMPNNKQIEGVISRLNFPTILKEKTHTLTMDYEKNAQQQWQIFLMDNEPPDGVPPNPDEVYVDEWRGWASFYNWFNPEAN